MFGNPHSASPSSLRSDEIIESTRTALLQFFGASPDEYTVGGPMYLQGLSGLRGAPQILTDCILSAWLGSAQTDCICVSLARRCYALPALPPSARPQLSPRLCSCSNCPLACCGLGGLLCPCSSFSHAPAPGH